MCRKQVRAQHEKESKQEYQEGDEHVFYTSSKKTRGNCNPLALSRSANRGRMPVGRKRPMTCPCGSMPVRSYWKISCIVIVSPSMPVISEMEVTRRDPSESRATCKTRSRAEEI